MGSPVNIEVSVVIPCYNAEAHIERCIDSVLAQSFENFEVLAVDDASCDSTVSRLRRYKDKRLRIITLDANSGSPAKPRNIGIQHAQGAFVAFLDCDDFWHPQKLHAQLGYMKDNAYPFSCTDYIVQELDGSTHSRQVPVRAGLSDLLTLNTIGSSTVMISKDFMTKFAFKNCPHEDFEMWLQILQQGTDVYGLNQNLTTYVKRQNSRSRLSVRNVAGFHALFKTYGEVGNLRAFFMMFNYFGRRRLRGTVQT